MTEQRTLDNKEQRESSPENNGTDSSTATAGKKKRTGPKRRKVTHGKIDMYLFLFLLLISSLACVYCRRSHMTCDDGKNK